MSGGNGAYQFRLGLLIALAVVLAFGSFWLLQVQHKRDEDHAPVRARTAPDYYVQKFTFVKMAKSHTTRYNISGDVLLHHPQDDSIEITRPIIHQFANGAAPMRIQADRAMVNSDDSEVHLNGHVDLDRPAIGKTEHLHAKSPALLILPDDEIVKTDAPVELLLGSTTLTGIGMVVNNASRQFNIASRVHAVLLPARSQ